MENSRIGLKYVGQETANIDYHHGQLSSIKGVRHIQVLRANRSRPLFHDEYGWTFNNAPFMAYWQDKFYLQYISCPVSENAPPSRTILVTSQDGITWEEPQILFPAYRLPEYAHNNASEPASNWYSMMHHRMGFYQSANGKLLALGFYGISPDPSVMPNDGKGIGRVIREIKSDGTFGPVYFIRFNRHAGWNEGNTSYPFYTCSSDEAFKQACEEILENKLVTAQWWEEDRSQDGFYSVVGNKALTYYHLDDHRVVGIWKWSKASISSNEGESWLPAEDVDSFIMAGGKVWGQKTSTGEYVTIYNPSLDNAHRWPLALAISKDGLLYDRLLLVNGEVPQQRYYGSHKYLGLNYVTGIAEGNGTPPGDALWVCYSMNKEDIWVTKIPLPIAYEEVNNVDDQFHDEEALSSWQIYSTQLSCISVDYSPGASGKSLKFSHADPYDYAKAERLFPKSIKADAAFRLRANPGEGGKLEMEVADAKSQIALRLIVSDGFIKVRHGGGTANVIPYVPDEWYDINLSMDAQKKKFDIRIGPDIKLSELAFMMPVAAVEKILFRTGSLRRTPTYDTELNKDDVPGSEEPLKESLFFLNHVTVEAVRY